jgi:putative ABC transport system ATP-binding protein
VLFDNSLEVREGEIVIMTGRSGSGKTTLLTLIGTLRSLQDGSIKVRGSELKDATTGRINQLRQDLGFIFQAHNLFESLTAFQNVNMAAELAGINRRTAKKRIYELLERLDLGNRIHDRPKSLSGGQKQRVAVARALVHYPKVVLADEPTAALDKKSTNRVSDLLKERAEQGCSIIVVTHDDRILRIADRIVNMEDGRIKSDVAVQEMSAVCMTLRRFPGFEDLSTTTLTYVTDRMYVIKAEPGETIIKQNEPGKRLYLIREGRVAVTKQETEGVVAELGEGEYFGEQSLINEAPCNATVTAREPCILYALDKADFLKVLEGSPSFDEELRRVIFNRS